jgi:tRNA(fMet)-specific endonuclease VapC
MLAGRHILLSSIVLFELRYGIERSAEPARNRAVLDEYLTGPVKLAKFDDDDPAEAGRLGAELACTGTPIGPYDILIAAQARRRACALATANIREFGRVVGLQIEDWTI